MLKKGLAVLICLAVMSALWAWGAGAYQIQTTLSGVGGTIVLGDGAPQTTGTLFRNYTTSRAIAVSLAAGSGYKIKTLTVNGVSKMAYTNHSTSFSGSFVKTGGTVQSLSATMVVAALPPAPPVPGSSAVWQLQTANVSAGGSITTLRKGVYTTNSGTTAIFKNYTGTTPLTASVNAAPGYQISSIQTPAAATDAVVTMASDSSSATVTGIPSRFTSVNFITANYRKIVLSGSNGVSVGTGVQSSTLTPAYGSSLLLVVTPPPPQNVVTSVSITGTPTPTYSISDVNGNPVSFPYIGTLKVLVSNVVGPVAASAQYGTNLVKNMADQCNTCHLSSTVAATLNSYPDWAASQHATVGVTCITCHQEMPGNIIKETVDPVSFKITSASAGTVGSYYCVSCHHATTDIASGFDGSLHKTATRVTVTCTSCHVKGPHNPAVLDTACNACHVDGSGNVANHPFAINGAKCTSCHNPHSTAGTMVIPGTNVHYNNITTGTYPASYVTSKAACTDCHSNAANNSAIRQLWYTSGHARTNDTPWMGSDYKTLSGCVRCHTTTGFIAYSTGRYQAAWGVRSDKTKEVLTCVGCHKDIATGELRSVAVLRPYADDLYQNRNVGASNICMNCHSGFNNGKSILSADFTNQAFVAPHFLAAAGTLHGQGGYNFPGQTYAFYSSNSHRGIGSANLAATGSAGPCIGCHKDSVSGHTFQAAARSAAVCANCHGGSMLPADLTRNQAAFDNALVVLKAMLKDRGFEYQALPPYFGNTNWGTGQAGADTMGAAYNYVMLVKEPGAYVHNGAYARKLVSDSIDYLYNGSVTGSIDSALVYLAGKGAITQAAADALASYQSQSGCTGCHSFTAGSTASHLAHGNAAISCADCHNRTALGAANLVPGTVTHANGVVNLDFAPGASGSYSGGKAGTCSNVYCHSDGLGHAQNMVWGASGPLTCRSCHPVLGGAHAAHVGNLLDTAFYNFTGNYSTTSAYRFGCSNCHPTDVANHRNGRIDTTLKADEAAGTLRSMNGASTSGLNNTGSGMTGNTRVSVVCSAAYCHSNGWSDGTLSYTPSPDWYNAAAYTGDRCAMCHGNSPNTTIPGSPAHAVHVVGIHALNVFSGGFGNLSAGSTGNVGHGIAAQSTTLNCNVCHSDTVTSGRNDANTACTACHHNGNTAQIANKALHVNGRADVVFANISVVSKAQLRPVSFAAYSARSWTRMGGYKNGAGSYDVTKNTLRTAGSWDGSTCSTIACHMGRPVDWKDTVSCEFCHTGL
jgi:trimeric autotransporter adhesin